MTERKGMILAGGSGTRLYPVTMGISKQLLPVYDKPMIFYPLSVLMLAGIKEIAIITTPNDQKQFQNLLQDGSQWGLSLTYIQQPSPDGLAQAYLLADDFLDGAPSALILGDNLFFGHGLGDVLKTACENKTGGTVFGYRVTDPQNYGVVEFADNGQVKSIIEKPEFPASNHAVTGLYFLDGNAPERARTIQPSARGELEITTLLETYLGDGNLDVKLLGRGNAWLDTGTHSNLLDAGNLVRTIALRQGLQIGNLEEIAYHAGWINDQQLELRAALFEKSDYGQYLKMLLAG
ncbi:MAG: glucose-1-phosphate thymidylyltransferase RfbA [Gammaproteobacteria bacterium]|nr:glucose-1-phosphate thymidylyltransferase RfbA [Gammaproteobacteria bacterium]